MVDVLSPHLFCFGLGYSALALARLLMAEGWTVTGTCRSGDARSQIENADIETVIFDGTRPLDNAERLLSAATFVLSSVPPDASGDPVLAVHGQDLERIAGDLQWVGYLSTTGVYGDTGGATVDESSPLKPSSNRSRRRVEAEQAWLHLHRNAGVPVHIFRLAGIYGPGRSAFEQVRLGAATRIDKPGHRFSRIHVADIVGVLYAAMQRLNPGAIYNVCDDEPAAASEVTAFACELLGVEPPSMVPFDIASEEMLPMALSFWKDNRIVDNSRIKCDLGVSLFYPTYREGLRAILDCESEE